MKNVLIVSATLKTNFQLAEDLKFLLEKFDVNINLISLEDYQLPLYTDDIFEKNNNQYKSIVSDLTNLFIDNRGIIICSPEYNGSIPPILTNAIAWISVSTDYWKDAFNNKVSLVCTSSGGPGNKYVISLKMQLEHLGSIVLPRSINVNSKNKLNTESANKILKQFVKLL